MAPQQQQNPPQEIKIKGRKAKKVPLDGNKEPRKVNFIKKILTGDKATQSASFSKRMPTLKKKACELQTLCDVSVCIVCYGDGPDNKFVWPEQETYLKDLILSYKQLNKNQKKESSCFDFMQEKKRKLEKIKEKAMKENIDSLISRLSKHLDGLSGDSLMDSVNILEEKVKNFKKKILELSSIEEKGKSSDLVFGNEFISQSDLIGKDFDNNWQLDSYLLNLDNNIDANYENFGSCNENSFAEFGGDNNIVLNNDFSLGFGQGDIIPDENFGIIMGENNNSSNVVTTSHEEIPFIYNPLPISMWDPDQPLY